MLKKIKESARDTAMLALVGSIFLIFKIGTTIHKLKKKRVWVCIHCDEEVRRGNGVALGDGECVCRKCYQPTFLKKMAE